MAEAAEKEESSEGEAAKPAGGSKLVLIVSLLNVLATLGIVAVLFISHQKEAQKESVEDIVAGQKADGHGAKAAHGKDAKAAGGHGEAAGGHGEAAGGHGEAAAGGHGAAAEQSAEIDAGKIIALEPFTVNLSTSPGTLPRYIRMNVSIELAKDASDEEFKVKTPRVRDTIISMLNSKKPNEVSAPQGRERLKEELKSALNSFLQTSKVADVYFTNFAVSN